MKTFMQNTKPHTARAMARFLRGGGKILIILMLFVCQNATAQIVGFPLSTHGTKSVNSDETWCTDRARVTNASGSGPYTLTLSDFTGSFTQDDWLMIIQMEGTGIGNYSMVNVLTSGTTTAPSTSLSVTPYGSNAWPTLSFGTNDRVQVVKISRHWNLTVTAGRITCPAYDVNSGTGGILAVMVGNDFVMSGGYFDVHAKGFYPHFPTGGLGAGGAGAAASSAWSFGGVTQGSHSASVDVNQEPDYSTAYTQNSGSAGMYGETNGALHYVGISPPTQQFYTSYNGQNGGSPNNFGLPGGTTAGEVNYNTVTTSSYPGTLVMGGSGVAGANGGTGGGGGGKGGDGGARNISASISSTGSSGSSGGAGDNGGVAGAGGAGGGILYLKVFASDLTGITNNQKRFIATGSQGANGGNGGDGGMGGAGGLGAVGFCDGTIGFVTPGGVGGYGDGGNGGNGGDAGSGGLGGTIWILKGGGIHTTAYSSFADNLGGLGGRGGAPGYKTMHTNTRRPRNYQGGDLSALTCHGGNFDHAPAFTFCPPVVCDCDEVFDYLGTMAGSVSFTASGGLGSISTSGGGSGAPIEWDFANQVLYYDQITGSCTTRFECRMKKQATFGEFMDKVFAISNLETYGGSPLNPGIDAVSMNGSNTRLLAPGGHLILEYLPLQDRLYDFDAIAQPYVDVDVCPFDYIVQGGSGTGSGGGPYTPDDDILIERTPGGNYGADAGATPTNGDFEEQVPVSGPVPLEGNSDALPEVLTHISPMSLNIEYAGQKLVHCELYSINGQLLGRYTANGSMQIPVAAPGIYILKLQSENKLAVRKLYIP
jgi:hypothetical protein